LNINETKWIHPFGNSYKDRNFVEKYLREIFQAADDNDGLRWKQIRDEIEANYGMEGFNYIWHLLASYTRSKLKELENE